MNSSKLKFVLFNKKHKPNKIHVGQEQGINHRQEEQFACTVTDKQTAFCARPYRPVRLKEVKRFAHFTPLQLSHDTGQKGVWLNKAYRHSALNENNNDREDTGVTEVRPPLF